MDKSRYPILGDNMQVVVYNEKMLDKVCIDLYNKLKEYGELSLCYEKPFKDKTKVVDF